MVQATGMPKPTGLRFGDGELPPELDRVNFGAFLLAFLWAPFHRLWVWFGVFVVLEALESAIGLGAPGSFGGLFEQPVVMFGFRVVYWIVTVAFALRANRLVWVGERRRVARTIGGDALRQPALVSRYAFNQRVWAVVGLLLLVGTPLCLLIGSVRRVPGAVVDVAVTLGTQAILLGGLWVHDRARIAHRQARD